MAISLVKKFSRKITNSGVFEIPLLFRTSELIISANCQDCRKTWHKAGYITQLVDIFPLEKVRVGEPKLILLGNSQICNFALFDSAYYLQFEFADWITTLDLQIFEPNMTLFQSESTPSNPQDITSQTAAKELALTATVIPALPVTPARKGIVIRNKGNKSAYGGFAPNLTANNAPYVFPGGTTFEQMEDFPTGEFFMAAFAGNTDIVVLEYI